jgi:hypothetical protein
LLRLALRWGGRPARRAMRLQHHQPAFTLCPEHPMRIDIHTRTMLDDRGVRRPVFTGLKRP